MIDLDYTTSTTTAYVATPTDATTNATTDCLSWYETVDGMLASNFLSNPPPPQFGGRGLSFVIFLFLFLSAVIWSFVMKHGA